jgi:acyl phosphate:glycerol-3-phosphate acyltransferase
MNPFAGPAEELLFICAGYAIGCLSPGYYLVRLRTGKDIRTIESGSTGSSNVSQVMGATGFIVTLLADAAKGGLAVWAARHFELSAWGTMAVFLAVVAGHIWPAQLGFHGGKGLATGGGALVALDYRLALLLCGIAVLGPLLRLGTASLLIAAVASPFFAAILGRQESEVAGLGVFALMALYAHRDNIRAFFTGRRVRKGLQA